VSENVQTAMFEILRSVQASVGDMRSQMAELRGEVAELKDLARKQRRDVAGILVMMKSVAGDFDERVSDLERKMAAVEQRPQS
jgi:uncharacterized protein YceH (UPF0502 family)